MSETSPSETSLCQALLHDAPVAVEPRARSPWAYTLWGILAASVFVLFHASILLVWNSPNVDLTKTFRKDFLTAVQAYPYFNGTHNNQSWEMFAPNPTRTNAFIRVLVEDQNGELWDLEHDIWEVDRYPYVWYSRNGKINRRIDGKKNYQRMYGAWVCREWERTHGGEPAKRVTFVQITTLVPHSSEIIQNGGWDQWKAPRKQVEQETIRCKTTTHAQLPNELRERYGLPLLEDESKVFRPIKQKTWWDQQEAEHEEPGGDDSPDQ